MFFNCYLHLLTLNKHWLDIFLHVPSGPSPNQKARSRNENFQWLSPPPLAIEKHVFNGYPHPFAIENVRSLERRSRRSRLTLLGAVSTRGLLFCNTLALLI